MKKTIFKLIPTFLLDFYRQRFRRYGFFGNYISWREARRKSIGYGAEDILQKVEESLLKVKEGKAVYERDSVLFDKVIFPWPLLTALLWIASKNGNKLVLVDFGGSLGTTYFQCRKFLKDLDELKWMIVEQKKYVESGKKKFEDHNLRFHDDLKSCFSEEEPDVILLSSVLQYLEEPYLFLKSVKELRFKYIIFDRTPFLREGEDRITIQRVPPWIYQASYPAWFFKLSKFIDFFSKEYELMADFESPDIANISSEFRGFIFRLKDV